MNRTNFTIATFVLSLIILLAAMGWLTFTVRRLNRAEEEARHMVAIEESVRLALWRMDSTIAPLIAQESAYPFFKSAFPWCIIHFRVASDGNVTSTDAGGKGPDRLDELRALIDKETLKTITVNTLPHPLMAIPSPKPDTQRQEVAQQPAPQQSDMNVREWQKRTEYSQQIISQNAANIMDNSTQPPVNIVREPLIPVWVQDDLFLVRHNTAKGGAVTIEGTWINWSAMKNELLKKINDLLPSADLIPHKTEASISRSRERMLASLPVALVPGELPPVPSPSFSPLTIFLVVAWVCALLAAGAVATLLIGTVRLSERRGAFVSAVTHELRTPLTTLRMYTEMLSEGMVSDGEKVKDYIETMRAEAERLGHLVENVLAYARLERRRIDCHACTATLSEILERAKERLARRTRQAGMELVFEGDETGPPITIHADPSIIEQILVNLVDNACKYAATAEDKRIHVQTGREGSRAVLRVRDHGPGIPESEARGLFRPFSKSAKETANSAPGIGLGLALCRRLARLMHGDLRYEGNVRDGACFALLLPLSPTQNIYDNVAC